MCSVSLPSKLLDVKIVLEPSKLAISVRGQGGLVDCSQTLQLASTSNSPWRRRGLTFKCLSYYLAIARKEADFLSWASRTLSFFIFIPSNSCSSFFFPPLITSLSFSLSSYCVGILEDLLLNFGGPPLQGFSQEDVSTFSEDLCQVAFHESRGGGKMDTPGTSDICQELY